MQNDADSNDPSAPKQTNSDATPETPSWPQLETDLKGLATLNSMQLQLIQNMVKTVEKMKSHGLPPA